MQICRVLGPLHMIKKHRAYDGKLVLLLRKVDTNGRLDGPAFVGVDYVGAGPGDYVLTGTAPGVARRVFGLTRAPIRTLIMAIVDEARVEGKILVGRR